MNTVTTSVLTSALLFVLSGCTGPIEIAPLPYAHPANPSAPPGTLPPLGTDIAPTNPTSHDTPGDPKALERGGAAEASTRTKYQCPMHPEIRSDEPGRCPICGMPLAVKENATERHTGTHER